MKIRLTLFLSAFILVLLFLGLVYPLSRVGTPHAAPNAQGFVTSTPGPDGLILYTVVAGDNCGKVALLHGITVTQLRQLNTRSEEHTSELQSRGLISYAVFCLKNTN